MKAFIIAGVFAVCLFERSLLVFDLDRRGVQPMDIVFLPCIKGFFRDFQAEYLTLKNAEFSRRKLFKLGLGFICAEAQISHKYHSPSLPAT